jgi:hypothetical protein
MSASGIAFLIVVWGVILINTGYCFYKLMTSERRLDGQG